MFLRNGVYGLIAISVFSACGNSQETIQPRIKPLIEAVYASGYVVSKNEYEVFAQTEGYLTGKMVEDGDVVKKGDVMFIIDADQQAARNRIAQENYAMALKNYRDNSPVLNELNAALEAARTKMQFDSLNFVRYSNLLKSNATSKAEFDRMKLAYENSRNEYQLQQSRYERTKNQLYLELQNAQNQLQITANERGRYVIRSQVDGMVFKTMKVEGEMIRRNEMIAVVGQKDAFYLELTVDELDVQRVKKDQNVVVKIDAYPNQVFHATISKVYPLVDRRQQSVQVDAELKEQLPGWFSGLAIEANIIIRQKENALVIPKAALLPGDSVLLLTDDGEKKTKIIKGIETLDEVEVVDGLDSSQRLIVNR